MAARLIDPQSGISISNRVGEIQRYTTNCIDKALEAIEVDFHIVVDRDSKILANRVNQQLRAVVVGGVDPSPFAIGRLHPQISGNRQELDRRFHRVDSCDQNRVGPLSARWPFSLIPEDRSRILVRVVNVSRVASNKEEIPRLLRDNRVDICFDSFNTVELLQSVDHHRAQQKQRNCSEGENDPKCSLAVRRSTAACPCCTVA